MAKKAKTSRTEGLPSRDAILAFLAENPGKAGRREIARAFGLPPADKIALKRLLREMVDDGLIEGPRTELRRRGDLPSVLVLRVEGVDADGDLVGVPAEWDEADGPPPRIPILSATRGRRDTEAPGAGDRVLARRSEDGARILKVLAKKTRPVLGIYRERDGVRRIEPVHRKGVEYIVADDATGGARDGELVSAEPEPEARRMLPRARVTERIGDVTSEKAISLIALEEHGIPHVFPPEALAEAERAEPAPLAGREDWRELPLVTIDPADARDHDDAVHAAPDGEVEGGFIVTVAIADVSWYVRGGSALDREARRRGNSVYFPGRVVPMLPERISNDLCSLREGEDRPALAVRMRFDASGRKTRHSFHRVTMRSAARLSYPQAQAAIDGNPDEKAAPLLDSVLRPLWQAYGVLLKGRQSREPLDINIPERKVLLNPDGSVDRVVVPPRLDAHRLIEEFMIQANVCAAETLEGKSAPVVYRIHDEPSFEKLEGLREFLGSLDMRLPKSGSLRPAQFNRILARVADTPNEILVNEVMLRSQAQAEYAVENIGHFGLNLRRYAHFTSPIRRYADLLVHRALVSALGLGEGGLGPEDARGLERIAGEISVAERRAMAAERDTVNRLIALYLAAHVGARFQGRIRGVTKAGLFVELDESGADGFVPISTLGDEYFDYEEAHHRLVGRETRETFRLGDRVEVRLVEAQPYAGSLLFSLEGHGRSGRAEVKRRRTRGRGGLDAAGTTSGRARPERGSRRRSIR